VVLHGFQGRGSKTGVGFRFADYRLLAIYGPRDTFSSSTASNVGPAQMRSVAGAKGVGLFCLIRKTENRSIYVGGNDLSQQQTGGGLVIMRRGLRRGCAMPQSSIGVVLRRPVESASVTRTSSRRRRMTAVGSFAT
jgi:hypothetical protein